MNRNGYTVTAYGIINFVQDGPLAPVIITGNLSCVNFPGLHGLHIHEFGNIDNYCYSCGPHYNPLNYSHAAPSDNERHAGDLGNIVADQYGNANINITDYVISLLGDYSIIGRSLVVTLLHDNFLTQPFGNSGTRIGCCVIGVNYAAQCLTG